MIKTHELKIEPKYFKEVINETKKFELRKDDREFVVGDELILREFDNNSYTGNSCKVKVTYKLNGGQYGLDIGYCILSIELIKVI